MNQLHMTTIELYRPSNGTEGDWFMERWCASCAKFEPCPEVGGKHCDIQMRSFCYGINDEEYPVEWRYEGDSPVCTAFDDTNPPTEADAKYLAWKAEQEQSSTKATMKLCGLSHL